MTAATEIRALRALARTYGVQTSYTDVKGRRRSASRGALLATLRALGCPVEKASDIRRAERERRRSEWVRPLEPVSVIRNAGEAAFDLRLPANRTRSRLICRVTCDDGQVVRCSLRSAALPVLENAGVDGKRFVRLGVRLPGPWPIGIHRLEIEVAGTRARSTLISAPGKAWRGDAGGSEPAWGVFAPLYALHSKRSAGIGDFRDLATLVDWTADLGGATAGTLPLLASFLDEPFEPSPYLPASRLFWNELFLALDEIPELGPSRRAGKMRRSAKWRREMSRMRSAPFLDYHGISAARRRLLEVAARDFFSRSTRRREAFEAHARSHPSLLDYARFRAAVEARRRPWRQWPASMRNGRLREGDYDEGAFRYHAYVQWLASQQVLDVAGRASRRGRGLYLDLPLGVHPEGYDAWRESSVFAEGATTGCPPDEHFTEGQDWTCPPLHPERSREQGHRYLAACLRHHMSVGGILRIDHVVGLHRRYWIPEGFEPTQGVYLRYPTEELYALLCLESHRHRCAVVGEDLGVVPPAVRPALRRHGMKRMFVFQFECASNVRKPLPIAPAGSVASLNTHDSATFAGFWRGRDLEDRRSLGWLSEAEARREQSRRGKLRDAIVDRLRREKRVAAGKDTAGPVLRGCLSHLADSDAELAIVNLEDLWLETRRQNVPCTSNERPNWRRRTRYPLETIRRMPRVLHTLRAVNRLREKKGRAGE